ncbi:META domain-containing protein [Glaciibacter psychrotolerans]|uniref:Heat shock protein HslJ n=1 Tax=Glaciibacter psychrotolerans TaxID=670054 RepID=A0A7Z0EFU5_9MICO|nr:META domain-containing protein [Leifsonia psychrotolerans]NYJ20891.1 heat shock protein HslJ [Leifsonia psychrotolerans]
MRKILTLTAITALALALGGCASNPGGSGTDATGSWGTVDVQGEPSLDLAEGGQLSGTDGCNRLTGTWTQDGNTVKFGPLGSTMMACDGVKTWLNAAESATVDGSTLTILGADGAEIGTLKRN